MKKNNINGNLKKIKKIFFLIITIYIYMYTLKFLNKIDLNIANDDFYKILIKNSSSLSSNNISDYEKIKDIIDLKPNNLLSNNLTVKEIKKEPLKNIDDKLNVEVNDEKEKKEPIVYIYNTHQTETYNSEYLAEYSITPTVMISSYMLKENLEDYGIYSYVEEDSVKEILNKNNWKYAKSYKVTKSFIEKRNKKIKTLKYYIDLHRDSVKRKYTTTEINGISYARVMLLVGLDHDNYKENLKEAEKINNKLNKYYPNLSRGIYKKSGSGVNGIYNQDFSNYVFLFEIGGIDNNINEVNNTMVALAHVLSEYINEEGYD